MTVPSAWAHLVAAIGAAEAVGVVPGVAVIGPGGQRFSHNGGRRFVAASTVKIPVAIELFRRAEEGALRLDDMCVLRPEDKAAGSGVLLHMHDGLVLALSDLAYLMMAISDNTATNLLIARVGQARVQAAMAELGMAGSTLGRTMGGRRVDDPAQENWAVPDEYAALIQALLAGTAGSAATCAGVVALLERQQNDRRIARHLPVEGRPRWGSKTGSLPGLGNDVGFVMTAAGPVIVAVFLEKLPDAHTGERLIGGIAKAALDDLAGASHPEA